jgi:putative heme-binding domain-containing protein
LGLFFLERQGADFVAQNARNLLASDDEWTSPIYAEVGPDGALWVVDWYNYIIQHNPTPNGFDNGKGNAYETPLRDKTHGRIYRVAYTRGEPSDTPTLDASNPATLVAALKNDNMLWRTHAQAMLVGRGQKDVVPQLVDLIRDPSVDALGLNPAAIHALWTLKGLGALDGDGQVATRAAMSALKHPSPAVRRAAVMTLPRNQVTLNALMEGGLLEDIDAQVRLATLLALAELPASDTASKAIYAAIKQDRNAEDRWLPDAVTAAAAKTDSSFIRSVLTGARAGNVDEAALDLSGSTGDVLRVVVIHYAQRGPTESIVSTLTSLKGVEPDVATAVLDGLMDGWPAETPPSLSASDKRQLEDVMDALPESVRDRLLSLGERWNVQGLFDGRMDAVIASLKGQVDNAAAGDAQRAAAAQRWIGLKDNRETADAILKHITLLASPTLSSGLVSALGSSRDETLGDAILEHWNDYTPSVRRAAISVMLRRSDWALSLLQSVQDGKIARTDIPPEYWTQLRQHPNRRVAGRASRLAQESATVSADRAEVVAKMLPLAKQKGDAERGKEVYELNCSICHKFNGAGGVVGPELTGIAARDRSDILLEILDPNRSVEANYRLWNVTTKDGNTYSGRLEAETQTTVEILDVAAQKHVIQRKDIQSLSASPMSIMPVGFEALPEEDLKGLLEYLAQPHEQH